MGNMAAEEKQEPQSEGGMDRPRISAIVTCFNEEHNIADCVESLLWCDELIVVDSYSEDRTPEIVKSFEKVKFFQRTYYGAGAQKNWALQKVTHDWIFILDADERCTPELKEEIEELLASEPKASAYMMNRRVFFLGKQIRYSGWQRDRVARLFRKGTAYYENRRVHSLLRTQGETPILKSKIDHHMVDRDFETYAFRLAKYGLWGAAQCWRDGERVIPTDIALRPIWRFIRTYILQRGILDGSRGLIFCLLQAYGTYVKFAILWGWEVNQKRGIEPKLPDFDDEETTWQGLQKLKDYSDE
jgi:glycosyltransferase involved in cell wall biosynthesis